MAKKQTQVDDIVKTMRENGGYATLAYLNRIHLIGKQKHLLKVFVVIYRDEMSFLKYSQDFGH